MARVCATGELRCNLGRRYSGLVVLPQVAEQSDAYPAHGWRIALSLQGQWQILRDQAQHLLQLVSRYKPANPDLPVADQVPTTAGSSGLKPVVVAPCLVSLKPFVQFFLRKAGAG
jgi:hypothetical protein